MRSQQQQIYDSKVSFCLPQLICLNKHLQIPDLKPAKSQRVVGTVGVFRYQHTHWPLGSNVMAFNRSNVDRYWLLFWGACNYKCEENTGKAHPRSIQTAKQNEQYLTTDVWQHDMVGWQSLEGFARKRHGLFHQYHSVEHHLLGWCCWGASALCSQVWFQPNFHWNHREFIRNISNDHFCITQVMSLLPDPLGEGWMVLSSWLLCLLCPVLSEHATENSHTLYLVQTETIQKIVKKNVILIQRKTTDFRQQNFVSFQAFENFSNTHAIFSWKNESEFFPRIFSKEALSHSEFRKCHLFSEPCSWGQPVCDCEDHSTLALCCF